MPTKTTAPRGQVEPCRDDHRVPLGFPPHTYRPITGPNAIEYYRDKHRRGEYGRHYGLHLVQVGGPKGPSA